MCSFMAFAIMDEKILYTVDRHEIGRYLLGCVVWLVFGARVVLANVNHSGLVSGLGRISEKYVDSVPIMCEAEVFPPVNL